MQRYESQNQPVFVAHQLKKRVGSVIHSAAYFTDSTVYDNSYYVATELCFL